MPTRTLRRSHSRMTMRIPPSSRMASPRRLFRTSTRLDHSQHFLHHLVRNIHETGRCRKGLLIGYQVDELFID